MFNACDFIFAGQSAKMYKVMLYDIDSTKQNPVSFGNKANIVETRTNNRIQPFHFGVNYHSEPLKFNLVFGSFEPLNRFDMERIAFWLTGHQEYQWLTICQDDLQHVQFRCLITELEPIMHGWLPIAFNATVQCDCPYAYGLPFDEQIDIQNTPEYVFHNLGNAREYLKPVLRFRPDSSGALQITNEEDNNREFKIIIENPNCNLYIENNTGIISDSSGNLSSAVLYSKLESGFFRLVAGDNTLHFLGSGELHIQGRFLYNIAG